MKIDVLLETSTSIPLFKGLPGGEALLKTLHDGFQLDPKQEWQPIQKINWTDLKGGGDRWARRNSNGRWMIMSFKQGAAAVRYDGDRYTAVVATPDGVVDDENFSSSKGVLDFIKRKLGVNKLLSSKAKMYMGSIQKSAKAPATSSYRSDLDLTPGTYRQWNKQVKANQEDPSFAVKSGGTKNAELRSMTGQELKRYRDTVAKQKLEAEQSSPEKILQRFKPLWLRAAKAALADINGVIQTMAKSGAYDRLKDKIEKNISPLQQAVDKLETGQSLTSDRYYYGNSPMGYFTKAINRAVGLTAVYYYPDETGNVNTEGTPDNPDGKAKLMADINRGDMTKLKTILDFFKQELMRAKS